MPGRTEPPVPTWPEGLSLYQRFLSAADEVRTLSSVDALPWCESMRRRVQHHGWRYDYRARRVAAGDRLGPLPRFMKELADRLVGEGFLTERPDQVIVNEYEPGQGIGAHIDCVPCFGDVVAILSLGSSCQMRFRHPSKGLVDIVLEPRSLLRLAGPARHEWTHEIAARRFDTVECRRRPRGRRVSLTFRTVIVQTAASVR